GWEGESWASSVPKVVAKSATTMSRRSVLAGPLPEKYLRAFRIDSTILLIASGSSCKETTADWAWPFRFIRQMHELCDELPVWGDRPRPGTSAPALKCCSWQLSAHCSSPRTGVFRRWDGLRFTCWCWSHVSPT